MAANSNITLVSLEDLKGYIQEETEKREVDFLETKLTHFKYKLLNIAVREKTKFGFKISYPEGVDGRRVMKLVGKICTLLMSFEQIKIGSSKLSYKFDEATGKTMTTESMEVFLESVKGIIFECAKFLVDINDENA